MFSDHKTDLTEKGIRERGPCRTVHSLAFSVSVVWPALLVTQRLIHHTHVHLKAPHGLMLLACNGTGSQKADDRVTTDLKSYGPSLQRKHQPMPQVALQSVHAPCLQL